MKKISIIYLMIALIMICTISVQAVSNNLYSMELIDGFEEIGKNCFADSEGNTINIVLTTLGNLKNFDYTEEYLEHIISQANNLNISSLREEMEQQLKDVYGDSLTDKFIQHYLDSIKIDGVLKKGIDKVGKNKYECFYYRTKWSLGADYSYFVDTYQVVSGEKIYTVTVSGTKEFLESKNAKDMLDSFEITNFKPVEKSSMLDDMMAKGFSGALETLILVGIFGGFVAIFNRKKKKSKNSVAEKTDGNESNLISSDDIETIKKEDTKEITEETILQEGIVEEIIAKENVEDVVEEILQPKYCNQCGAKLGENWEFCNNCGVKVRK